MSVHVTFLVFEETAAIEVGQIAALQPAPFTDSRGIRRDGTKITLNSGHAVSVPEEMGVILRRICDVVEMTQ